MIQALINIFKIAELRQKILFTLGMLVVYRIGFWIPLPGVNQEELARFFATQSASGGAFGKITQFVAIFSGGQLSQSTIFGLGIMPYISASIIFQLVSSVSPALKKIQNEGPTGRQKIQEWTRYATVGLCVIQAVAWLSVLRTQGLVYSSWSGNPLWWVMAATAMTAGTIFLMWLGEQIDRYGIGNGASMIIMAGILTGMPNAILWVWNNFDPSKPEMMGWGGLILILAGFVLVVGGSVILTVAQRRIPVQQAKHTRGRRVYGGQRSYLPLRVNHGGVMPIIFASSLMIFPAVVLSGLAQAAESAGSTGIWTNILTWMSSNFTFGAFPYLALYVGMVFFFSYFWITVQFNPEEMSKQLRDHGTFIPGLRPGPRTAEYLETVMERITYVGATFLAVIAVMPMVVNQSLNVDFMVTQFLGGTGLLIVVSVVLDFVQRVEANLLMRNYAGFLGGNEEGRGPRMRGPRG
jgi:preprotein translocase subunit SecY